MPRTVLPLVVAAVVAVTTAACAPPPKLDQVVSDDVRVIHRDPRTAERVVVDVLNWTEGRFGAEAYLAVRNRSGKPVAANLSPQWTDQTGAAIEIPYKLDRNVVLGPGQQSTLRLKSPAAAARSLLVEVGCADPKCGER